MIGSDKMLSEKHRRFIEEYIIDGVGKDAYMRVYPDANEKTAKDNASKLLKNPEVAKELERIQKERMERVMWSSDEILKQIKEIAYSESASKTEKLKALELAAKSLGMFREKIEHSGGLSIVLGQDVEEWAE
jgi:phage terminase small subunit